MTFGFHGLIKSKSFPFFFYLKRQSLWVSDVTDRKQRWIVGGSVVYGDVFSDTWLSFIQIEIKEPLSLIHVSGSIFCLYKGYRIEVIQITSLEI